MRLLYVTEDVPNRDPVHGDGSSMIPYQVIQAFPSDVVIDLLTFRGPVDVPTEISRRCATVRCCARRSSRSALLLSAVSRASIGAAERDTADMRRHLTSMSAVADVTLLHGPHLTSATRRTVGPTVLQVVDPWSSRAWMEAEHAEGLRAAYRRHKARQALDVERRVPEGARLLTVGARDAAAWSAELERPVRPIANGVAAATATSAEAGGPATICFLGSLDYGPNIDSVRRLVLDVAPLVWRRAPSTRVLIAGRNPSDQVRALAGGKVEILANVPDVAEVFRASSVAVFPDQQGLGIRNSVTEALAYGVPVVATDVAAREQADHPLLHLGTSAAELADVTVALLAGALPVNRLLIGVRTWEKAALEYHEELLAAC